MPPQPNPIKPKSKMFFNFKKPPTKAIVVIVVAILVIIGGSLGFYWQKHSSSKASAYSYKYKQLNSYTMSGNAKGNGISLQKPVELTSIGTTSANQTQAYLNQAITGNNQSITGAQIFLASVNAGVELQDVYKKNMNDTITDPKSVGHEAAIKPLKDYVTQRLKTTLGTTFSDAKPLITDNIKANAWYLTLTSTPKDAKDKATQPNLSGEVILAIGKSTFYYVLVYSLSNNWQSNQKVWDQVINSIKLDQ